MAGMGKSRVFSDQLNMDASAPDHEEDISKLRAARDAALQAAQTAIRDSTRLTRLLTILSDSCPIDQMLDQVLSALSELFSADIVVLLDPAYSGTYKPLAAVGIPEDLLQESFTNLEGSYSAATIETLKPILVENIEKDDHVDRHLRDLGAKTGVWLPVRDNLIVRGALILVRCTPALFNHADIGILTAMAYRIGLALEQAQRSQLLENTVHIGREIGANLDENAVCTKAVAMFPAIIGAEAAALFLKDKLGKPELIAESGFNQEWIPAWTSLTEYLISDLRLNTIRSYNTYDLQRIIGQFNIAFPPTCPVSAHLAVPVQFEGQVQGMLYGMRFSTFLFNPDTLQIAMLYAGQTASAIENARLYRAVRDELAMRKRVERALRSSDERFRALIRSVSDVISILSDQGHFLYLSPAAETAWKCPASDLLQQSIYDRISLDDREKTLDILSSLVEQPNATIMHSMSLRYGKDNWRDYEVIFTNLLHEPAVGGIVATYHDITDRKTYEQELRRLVFRDPLTGLSNRAHFAERLDQALMRANAEYISVGLIFFDLDDFKIVNDRLGHEFGDQVLCVIAKRVKDCLRKEDVAARLGGDEFTVLIESVKDADQVISLAQRLLNVLNDTIRLDGLDLCVGASLGIALSVPNYDNVDDLLRKADLAMYDAKKRGKGSYSIFDSKMNAAAIRRLEFEAEIQHALRQREFRLCYQPIYAFDDRKIFAIETLLRWQHPKHGLIMPSDFIPLAEETGVMTQLGNWIIDEALNQFSAWRRQYRNSAPLLLDINISPRQLHDSMLEREIIAFLKKYSLEPHSLMVEVSERAFAQASDAAIMRMNALKRIGIRIAIDDFGSGNINLSLMKKLPIDVLKIDLSLIRGIESDLRNTAIVEGLVFSALSMGLTVIAEGVATSEQMALLQSIGCNYGQGYFFSPALPADELFNLLKPGFPDGEINLNFRSE